MTVGTMEAVLVLLLACFARICLGSGAVAEAPRSQVQMPPELHARLEHISLLVSKYVADNYGFCIRHFEQERALTFDFNADADAITQCEQDVALQDKLCTTAELQIYFSKDPRSNLPENVNCNSDNFLVACEPGFAGPIDPRIDNATAEFTTKMPIRTDNYVPCCEGFFCPKGLACMMPCPLGAYCPSPGNLHVGDYSTCEPYTYSPPSKSIGCGGANKWGIAGNGGDEMFCPKGSYCPTPTEIYPCDVGSFCRKGSSDISTCSPLVTCEEGTGTQDLHFVGFLVIGILVVVLVVVFKCTDTIMKLHGKRAEKLRAFAAKHANDLLPSKAVYHDEGSPYARRRASWTERLGLTFLTRSKPKPDERVRLLDPPASPSVPSPSSPRRGRYAPPAVPPKLLLPADLKATETEGSTTPSMTRITKTPAGASVPLSGFVDEPVPTPGRGAVPAKTHTENYKYAFKQLAQEQLAAQEASSSSSGALCDLGVESPTLKETKFSAPKVPPIELEFHNLGLTLKKSGKRILQGVTGQLRPGRVAAVMGPSGAGKTTFLTALAGKETYSYTTGTVWINGAVGSIASYRKSVGFVPQDDIVHGNLTVEENLWFSAGYRLPIAMPKHDKVFAVERAIWALGLEPIRSCLVGTVEARGISGGQRKRVNVGLEMVAEPSLLILDEPTSGLDSTSSRLVVQALRREASRGVTVGVVLHQPSYGIFRMFDDVMFLAKGGRTVYLGPVTGVEAYFESLGFVVPNRVNPPDHIMDVLEGLVKPEGNPDFHADQLPELWNGHSRVHQVVPLTPLEERRQTGNGASSSSGVEPLTLENNRRPYWATSSSNLDVLVYKARTHVKHELDELAELFQPQEDLSGRTTPGFWYQYKHMLKRTAKQRFREVRLLAQDYIILLITGAALGFLSATNDDQLGGFSAYTNTTLAVSLLTMISALRSFSQDTLTFFREAASGINRVSYFLAKDTVDLVNVLLKPVFYLSMFYFFNNPRSTFQDNYGVTVALVYCAMGIAYFFAIILPPSSAQLTCSVFALVSTLLGSRTRPSQRPVLALYSISFARWALEAYLVANAERYSGVWLLTRCAVLRKMGYDMSDYGLCIGMLLLFGALARVASILCLFVTNRDKQK